MIDWLKGPSVCILALNSNLVASVDNYLYLASSVSQEMIKCLCNEKRISSGNKSLYILFLNLIVLL